MVVVPLSSEGYGKVYLFNNLAVYDIGSIIGCYDVRLLNTRHRTSVALQTHEIPSAGDDVQRTLIRHYNDQHADHAYGKKSEGRDCLF